MIEYQKFTLDNGLQVFVHQDKSTPLAAVNIIYNVGSRDENENKTGFAHLFEHLMFGGSLNIPSYDEPLQRVGGENNAFTNPDITNYYITLPSINLETAFWLESDRMLSLSFNPNVLEVQRKVVIEEFKQRYLNQPYGDIILKLRELAYKVHPYKWATIGKEISHIENATMDDVKSFFFKFYRPNNAVLVVAGNVEVEEVKKLSEKWFGSIPAGETYHRNLPKEPTQKEKRFLDVAAKVPLDAIYKAYHMPDRLSSDYHAVDLLSDILGRGKSSRLYTKLVKDKKMFSSLNAHITGSMDPGLLMITGKLNKGIAIEEADAAIEEIIEEIKSRTLTEQELQKVKNQAESNLVFSELELLNRAMNLAYGAVMGHPDMINEESELIQKITLDDVKRNANAILTSENCNTMYYRSEN